MKNKYLIMVVSFMLLWSIYCLVPIIFNNISNIGQIKIYDRNDYLITHIQKEGGMLIPIEKNESLPPRLISFLIKAEDKRFLSHFGIDIIAKIRAFKSNISAKKIVSGGSTLTEQLVKNKYFRRSQRNIIQKIREANIAFITSIFISKEEVLRQYLNTVYFGNNLYGVKTASYVYFEKSDLSSLTDEEIITLLSLLRAPSTITTNETYFKKEFQKIVKLLQVNIAYPEINFKKFTPINLFPHVTTKILDEIKDIKSSSIIIKSTIDRKLQEESRSQIAHSLDFLKSNNVNNAAAYVFNPQSGEILVWQGSRDFYNKENDGQVNVIEKKRQMGSTLKPFIYLFAFINGAHPDNLIVDLEKDFYKKDGKGIFRPLNYSLYEGGIITLKEALASSFNISAVRILDYLGLENTFEFLKSIGLQFDYPASHYGLSLALGSPDLTMRNVAETYGVLANNGIKKQTSLISAINGNARNYKERVVLDQNSITHESLYYLQEILSSQVHRRRSFGLNSILNTSIPFAVKTGTTKNFKDNWTFGYRPDLVVAVWAGNNNSSSMVNVSGITGAAPIWHRIIETAIKMGYVSNVGIPIPDSLHKYKKCISKSCNQNEIIFQSDNKKWESDLINGKFCLEDFYIQDIEIEEIQKISKLFHFNKFEIKWCNNSEVNHHKEITPVIIKPKQGEIFYIKKDLPIELQKIIIKANKQVEWIINEEEYDLTDVIFLQPDKEKYSVKIKGTSQEIEFFVKYTEE